MELYGLRYDFIMQSNIIYVLDHSFFPDMVVSGLPIRNGDLHAGEIASVSLDLLSSMCDFKIRHMPGTILQLRIGMHSGMYSNYFLAHQSSW